MSTVNLEINDIVQHDGQWLKLTGTAEGEPLADPTISLVYPIKTQLSGDGPVLNRSIIKIEAWPSPNYSVGRVVDIWHAGFGVAGMVDRRTIAADLGNGLFGLDSPLSADLIAGEDVAIAVVVK